MRYVQLVLTESQVGLLATASKNAMLDAEGVEREQLSFLTDFLYAVEANPAAFPVKTPAMVRSIKKRVARLKGPAQPKRQNPRKRAQLRAQGSQKRSRAQRRDDARAYNEALAAVADATQEIKRERSKALGLILPSRRRTRTE